MPPPSTPSSVSPLGYATPGSPAGQPLPLIHLWRNWKIQGIRQPKWLVYGLGPMLDGVTARFVDHLTAQASTRQVRLGRPPETTDEPGLRRSVRVVRDYGRLHHAGVDVTLVAQGTDLYVRYEGVAQTWIAALRWALCTFILVTLFCGLLLLYASATNARAALAQDFAGKYYPQRVPEAAEAMLTGTRAKVDRTEGTFSIQRSEPWGLGDYFRKDPVLFLTSIGKWPALLVAAVGVGLAFLPRSAIAYPCRLLGWPTPEDFDSEVESKLSWVQARMSEMLFAQYHISLDKVQMMDR